MKKLLVFVLSALMLSAVFPTSVFAATENDVKEYSGYTCFGDSMTRGLGSNGDNWGIAGNFTNRNVEGAYPYIISQAINCGSSNEFSFHDDDKYWPIAFFGQSLSMTLDMIGIEDAYYDEIYDHDMYKNYYQALNSFFNNNNGTAGHINDVVAKSDLITTNLGLADCILKPITFAVLDSINNIDYSNPSNSSVSIAAAIYQECQEGLNYWKTNYPKFIKYLKQTNPSSTICLVGYFNPISGLRLSDEYIIPIGDILNPIVIEMNQQLRNMAYKYDCIYVDIYNADTPVSENTYTIEQFFSTDSNLASHISQSGHQYVARQILNALPSKDGEVTESFDIRVDLSRFTSINNVKVNGKTINNYNISGTVLTVPWDNALAKTLDVTIVDEDNKIIIIKYYLKYQNGQYIPYRYAMTNDAAKDANTIKKGVSTITKGLFDKFVEIIKSNKKDTEKNEEAIKFRNDVITKAKEITVDKEKQKEIRKEIIEIATDGDKQKEIVSEIIENSKEIRKDIIETTKDPEKKEKIRENIIEGTQEFKKAVEDFAQDKEKQEEIRKDIIEDTQEFKKAVEDFAQDKEKQEEIKDNIKEALNNISTRIKDNIENRRAD